MKAEELPKKSRVPAVQLNLFGILRRNLYFLKEKLHWELPDRAPHRFPWSAAYLALIPGGGAVYNKQPTKALVYGSIQVMSIVAVIITILHPWNNYILLISLFWHFFAMADAYSTAVKINGMNWSWKSLLAVCCSFIFLFCSSLFFLQFFGQDFFQLVTVKTPALAPKIQKGDKYFVLKWPFGKSSIKPGSLVYYDPPRFAYHRPGALSTDTYSINEENSFGVITAREGDLVSWESPETVKVNEVLISPNRLPVYPEGIPGRMEFRIPEEHFAIIFSHSISEGGITGDILEKVGFGQTSFKVTLPNPRQALAEGMYMELYDEAIKVHEDEIYGVVLFRYYPPERRKWFGTSSGLWEEYPPYK